MNAPTMPHVAIPQVSLPQFDVHDVTERVQEVAAAAAERIEKLPDRAVALAGSVIPALRPPPKRSKRPFLLLAVALVAALGVAWFVRGRRQIAMDSPDATASSTTGDRSVSAAS